MGATREFGTWGSIVGGHHTPADTVALYAGGRELDFGAIAARWVAEINARLPEGVELRGSDVYGPAVLAVWVVQDAIREAVAETDLGAIIKAHEDSE